MFCFIGLATTACMSTSTATYLVMFGRDIGNDDYVSDWRWNQFERKDIAPILEGYTILYGEGAYRLTGAGTSNKEDMILLYFVGNDSVENHRVINAIAERYKDVFKQDSVLITRTPTYVISKASESRGIIP